jgi:hypothetical protein
MKRPYNTYHPMDPRSESREPESGKGLDEFEFYLHDGDIVKQALKYRWWEAGAGIVNAECQKPECAHRLKHADLVTTIEETISALTGKRVNYIEII